MNANLLAHTDGSGTYVKLSAQNAPASTVLLCEIQSAINVFLTADPEAGSPTANGSYYTSPNTYAYKNAVASVAATAVYATGPIGGYAGLNMIASKSGVHSDGSNFLAEDGHVKWLRGSSVSGGDPAAASTDKQTISDGTKDGIAAGTGSMKLDDNATSVVMTFSPN